MALPPLHPICDPAAPCSAYSAGLALAVAALGGTNPVVGPCWGTGVIQSPDMSRSDNMWSMPDPKRWVTDEDLLAARHRFADGIPGFSQPVAYSVARLDDDLLTFGYVNAPTSEHRLPAVVLATFCGYINRTGTYPLSTASFSHAVAALSPAEAATHWQHPNLWSWRQLLEETGPGSRFLAFYVSDLDDPVANEHDAAFRSLLRCEQNSRASDYEHHVQDRS